MIKLTRAGPVLAGPWSGEQVGVCLDVEGGGGGAGHREVADQHQPALNLHGDIKNQDQMYNPGIVIL